VPGITDRSTKKSLLEIARRGHGMRECMDICTTLRFYEEVLGLEGRPDQSDVAQGA
jgi:hypothetical protein